MIWRPQKVMEDEISNHINHSHLPRSDSFLASMLIQASRSSWSLVSREFTFKLMNLQTVAISNRCYFLPYLWKMIQLLIGFNYGLKPPTSLIYFFLQQSWKWKKSNPAEGKQLIIYIILGPCFPEKHMNMGGRVASANRSVFFPDVCSS